MQMAIKNRQHKLFGLRKRGASEDGKKQKANTEMANGRVSNAAPNVMQ